MDVKEKLIELFDGYYEIITVREAALVIRCSKEYIIELIKNNQISCFMVGSHFRVFKQDIVTYFANNKNVITDQ